MGPEENQEYLVRPWIKTRVPCKALGEAITDSSHKT
jgi:hypothetical protein